MRELSFCAVAGDASRRSVVICMCSLAAMEAPSWHVGVDTARALECGDVRRTPAVIARHGPVLLCGPSGNRSNVSSPPTDCWLGVRNLGSLGEQFQTCVLHSQRACSATVPVQFPSKENGRGTWRCDDEEEERITCFSCLRKNLEETPQLHRMELGIGTHYVFQWLGKWSHELDISGDFGCDTGWLLGATVTNKGNRNRGEGSSSRWEGDGAVLGWPTCV